MAATKDRFLNTRSIHVETNASHPVAADTKIFQHTFVGKVAATGLARPLVAGDEFLGLATEQADNTDGLASAIDVKLRRGTQINHAVTGVTGAGDVNKLVYASDDQTLTLTPNNSPVGVVDSWISSTSCYVHLFTTAEIAAL
jgi:hypothetical protein